MSWNKGNSWIGQNWGQPYSTSRSSWEQDYDWSASPTPSWGDTAAAASATRVPWRDPPPVVPHFAPPMQAVPDWNEKPAERKARRQREDAAYRQWLQAEFKRLGDSDWARQKRKQLKVAVEQAEVQDDVDEEQKKDGDGEDQANVAPNTDEHGDPVAADASSSQSKPVNKFGEEERQVDKMEEDEQSKHDRDNNQGTTVESRPESSENVNIGDLPTLCVVLTLGLGTDLLVLARQISFII